MASHEHDPYPAYSRPEKLADGAVHLIGIGASLSAIATFLVMHYDMLTAGTLAGLLLYWVGLIAMLTVSFCYHMTPWEQYRAVLRRADHATIFLKIAGTYTPLVISIGSMFSYIILALVWALALVGAVTKLFMWRKPGALNALLYLALGWISVLLIWSVFEISHVAGWCAVIGGLLYSAGVIFFLWESLKFANAVWHCFVVVASGFFFGAVWLIVTA
ncbi:MAG: hemolysin III family protein [Pseudomonadota bacterium]